ncbi:LytR/AlgR family response regulator transcription factor [Selenomonas dianae]|uniref:Response regulatory domain-containing protein n=1 Tax=Selenomonas dianae TaxID=135079 RepID=A0ABP3CF70_9FIRM|nr:response regulator [Selenomonas dianae]WLD82711.1 response regulator [Selenomonas dianae]
MRIAIVDDEPEVCGVVRDYLTHILEKYWAEKAAQMEVEVFDSAESVLEVFEHRTYDLLILDIRMPGIGGMEAARRIRNQSSDVGIIFLTSSEEYLMEGYRVFADGYFLKTEGMDEEGFRAALARVLERREKAARVLKVQYNGQPLEILLNKIYYVDLSGGRLHIALAKHDLCLTRPYTYDWATEQLGHDPRFLECYHRVLVNMDVIERMDKESFVLTNGAEIPISQRRRSGVRTSYMQYLLNK